LAWAALALAAPVGAGAFGATPSEKPFGLLLLGAGDEKDWKIVENAVALKASKRYPLEFAAGRADVKNIQRAIDRLQSQKARKIVAVPLFLGTNSELMDQTRYLFGIRQDPSPEFFGSGRVSRPSLVRRVQSKVPLVLTQALDDQPVVVDVLTSRALALSKGSAKESVVLVSPAPSSEKAAEQWAQTLNNLAERVRAKGGFKSAAAFLLNEDGRQSTRDKRREKFKAAVQELSRRGPVLVVPFNLTASDFARKIPRVLRGTFMRFDGKALLPDERIAAWVEETALAAVKLPDMRMFKDAGRALPKTTLKGALK
jgi:hypothetical protein